jgi:MFS family permease
VLAQSIIGGSALWALLPVIASQELQLSALGYGVLLGSVGIGAVCGVPLIAWLRARYSLDMIVTMMTVVQVLTTLALGYFQHLWLLNAAMILTGAAWLVLTSCLNVAAQTIVPGWVQARALGVFQLVFQGCFAAGAASWGAVAGRVGNAQALLYAALALAVGMSTALHWHLRTGEDLDLRPSKHMPLPETVVEPALEEGPVLVQIEYRIREGEDDKFVQALEGVRLIRLRDGAFRWEVFRDPTEPGRFSTLCGRACRLRCSGGRAAAGAIGIASSVICSPRSRTARRSSACSRPRRDASRRGIERASPRLL